MRLNGKSIYSNNVKKQGGNFIAAGQGNLLLWLQAFLIALKPFKLIMHEAYELKQ
jgi:hypothetical protein